MRRVVYGFLASVVAASTAHADEGFWVTGQQLVQEHCDKNQLAANRFVAGIMDSYYTGTQTGATRQYCSPANATAGQATAIACKYARDNPGEWNVPAAYLIIKSLQDAWPCKGR